MISASAAFISALQQSSRKFNARLLDSGTELDITIRRLTVYKGSCGSTSFAPGAVYVPYIDVTADHYGQALKDKRLQLQIGVMTGGTLAAPTYDYITLGFFTVKNVKSNSRSTTFTAYGQTQGLEDELFFVETGTSSLTIQDVLDRIESLTGIIITVRDNIDTSVAMSALFVTRTITGELSCKDALVSAAFVAGGYATETADGNIAICKYTSTVTAEYTAADTMTTPPEVGDSDTIITGVQVDVSGTTYTQGTPVNLKLTSMDMTATAFPSFANNLIGLTYRGGDVSLALGDPRLEPWDVMRITDTDNTQYVIPCMYLAIIYDGGLQTRVTAPAIAPLESGKLDTALQKAREAAAAAAAAKESVDNLEIGGRNLIIGTLYPDATGSNMKRPHLPGQISNTSGRGTCTVAEHGLRFTLTEQNWCYIYFGASGNTVTPCMLGLEAGETYTLSADLSWKILSSDEGRADDTTYYMGAMLMYSDADHLNSWSLAKRVDLHPITQADKGTDMSGRLVFTFTVPEDAVRLYLGIRANNTIGSHYAEGDYIEARNLKLEKGNHATGWTPAPEDLETSLDNLAQELIVGTHGTTATAAWTGTSTVLTELKTGTRIQYKLSSAGASNVTLNLTLKNGTTTGAKPVYYLNTTRLSTQYAVNAVIDLIYDGDAWRVLNPYKNDNTVGTYGGAVTAGSNGVKNYSLVMRDTETTWVSLTTSAGTGTSKQRYTGGLYPDNVMYMGSSSTYAAGATTGNCYEALGVNLNYSTNSGSTLVARKPVYLVGEIHSDGLFYLDPTWWTQTEPTTEDGKTYIYLGLAYSTSNVYLVPDNTLYQYSEGKFRTLTEIEQRKAARTATNYMASDTTGVMIADLQNGSQTPSTATGKNVLITAGYMDGDGNVHQAGTEIRDGQTVVARFGATVQLGQDDNSHMEMDYHSMQLTDKDGNVYFYVSDLRDDTGYATITETFTADGLTTDYQVMLRVDATVSAVDSSDATNTATVSGKTYSFDHEPAEGAIITIVYKTTQSEVKAYTLGVRDTSKPVGPMSCAEGYYTAASGYASHAEGNSTEASGRNSHAEGTRSTASDINAHAEGYEATASGSVSHAEGYQSTATGAVSHAEGHSTQAIGGNSHAEGFESVANGICSHAEGNGSIANGQHSHAEGYVCYANGSYSHAEGFMTTAGLGQTGYAAHAEGYDTTATGRNSHAQGLGTIASSREQMALGKYNDEDTNNVYAVIVGNGSGDSDRSNAFGLKWNGDMVIALDTTASSGSLDADLYDAIVALGWDSDVIV